MAKIIPISEHFQHFVSELRDSFWGDLEGHTQRAAQQLLDRLSEAQRDQYMVRAAYERGPRTSAGRGRITATATTSGISSPSSAPCGYGWRGRGSGAFCPTWSRSFSGGPRM